MWRQSRPLEFLLHCHLCILSTVFLTQSLKKSAYFFVSSFTTTLVLNSKLQQFNLQLFYWAWSTNRNIYPDKLQSDKPSCDVVPSCFMEIDRLINQAVISRIALAVKKLRAATLGKSTTRRRFLSYNFGVSHKCFKPSTPGCSRFHPLTRGACD